MTETIVETKADVAARVAGEMLNAERPAFDKTAYFRDEPPLLTSDKPTPADPPAAAQPTTVPAPATIGMGTFREGPAGALLFGGPTGAPTFVLLNLLLGTSPDVLLDDLGGTIRSDTARGKPPESTIVLDLRNGLDLLLRVDPSTKLL